MHVAAQGTPSWRGGNQDVEGDLGSVPLLRGGWELDHSHSGLAEAASDCSVPGTVLCTREGGDLGELEPKGVSGPVTEFLAPKTPGKLGEL